jgi:hypothetical protein
VVCGNAAGVGGVLLLGRTAWGGTCWAGRQLQAV